MIDERMAKTAFDAEKLTIMSVNIAIARDDTHQLRSARAERHLASIRAIRASRNDLIELPRPSLMAIRTIEQRSRRTNLDAIAALRAIQPTAVSSDDCICAAITGLDGLLAHPFITYPRATLAEDAALGIVCNHRRKIFLRLGI